VVGRLGLFATLQHRHRLDLRSVQSLPDGRVSLTNAPG
jgi:hypothetical protein